MLSLIHVTIYRANGKIDGELVKKGTVIMLLLPRGLFIGEQYVT